MTSRFQDEDATVIRFGGGRNSRASEDQVHDLECTDGENFILDPGNSEFRPRPPFDLVGTVPNTGTIRGFATLLKTDGTVTMLVQSDTTVYSWDGSTFTSVGAVNASANIRGKRESIWALSDVVLIADISGAEDVLIWDGTTLSTASFFQADGSTSIANFKAKYIVVEKERAFFGNVNDGTSLPHVLVGSQRGDYTIISPSAQRPGSALSEQDAWFLPMPQLKPINGMGVTYGVLAISQEYGALEQLTGVSAKDFDLGKLYRGSGAAGTESIVTTENDIIYGAIGRIESLRSTQKFGDVESDDISFKIKPDVKTYTDWTLVYNPTVKRVYCFPSNTSEVHVLHTEFIGSELSPWSKYTTQHDFGFQPTATMLCYDPTDGLEYVFMGDALGNLYRMEGTGLAGDAGQASIRSTRTSRLHSATLDAKAFNVHGWVQHRKLLANDLNLCFLMAGEHVHDIRKTTAFAAVSFDTVYGGSVYYGGDFYYGVAQENRLVRRQFKATGQGNAFQVKTEIDTVNDFAVQEVGLRHDAAA